MLRKSLLSAAVCGLLIVGCEKEAETPSAPPPPAQNQVDISQSVEGAKEKVKEAESAVKESIKEGEGAVKEMAEASESTIKDLIEKAQSFINDKQLDKAEPLINQLKGMESKIPESLKGSYDALVKAYEAAKQGAGALNNMMNNK
jgi:hypothetical protein